MNVTIYLDTNIFKFSANSQLRMVPRKQILDWGHITQEVVVHDLMHLNPNGRIKNNDLLKSEAGLLKDVAELAKKGRVKFVINTETLIESWGIPNMDSTTGKFYGAPYEQVKAPIEYSRTIMGFGVDSAKDAQFNFLSKIDHPRFYELMRMTGAYQGKRQLNRNQLLDAFHIWCAEHNNCTHFLTLDLKLIKMMRRHKDKVSLSFITPSEILELSASPLNE